MSTAQPILYNETKNLVLARRVIIADGPLSRLQGLLFRSSLPPDEALWLVPCSGIHMYFMRFPIDVIFLDQKQVIIHLIHRLRPWQRSPFLRKAASVLELPAGSLWGRAEVGDRLVVETKTSDPARAK